MKRSILLLTIAAFLAGCTCEDPQFLLDEYCNSEFATIVSPPAGDVTDLAYNFDDPVQDIITIVFSEPMDTNNVYYDYTISIFETSNMNQLSGYLHWTDYNTLVYTLNGLLPETCLEGCEIEFRITDDGDSFYMISLSGEMLDTDCDNKPGGSYSTTYRILLQ